MLPDITFPSPKTNVAVQADQESRNLAGHLKKKILLLIERKAIKRNLFEYE